MEKKFVGLEVLRLGTPMPSGRIYADNAANRDALDKYRERIEKDTAFVEFGMPELSGIDQSNQPTRLASISHRRTCARVTDMRIVDGTVLCDFEATGELAPELLKMLEETGEQPVFGLRSFTLPSQSGLEYTLKHIVSFDFIGTIAPELSPLAEPGRANVNLAADSGPFFSGNVPESEARRVIDEIIPAAVADVERRVKADPLLKASDLYASPADAGVELPDGSGVMTASFPLPKDHWIYDNEEGNGQPPMPMRMGTISPFRPVFEKAVREAARYAVRASTRCGTEKDFDPDALVANMLVGLFGFNSEDGLSGDALDAFEQHPRFFAGRITLPVAQIKDIALANGFTEKPQGEGKPDDLHPYVYEFANAMSMASMTQFIGELGTAAFLADVEPPKPAAKLDVKND